MGVGTTAAPVPVPGLAVAASELGSAGDSLTAAAAGTAAAAAETVGTEPIAVVEPYRRYSRSQPC